MLDVNVIRDPTILLNGLTGLDRVFKLHYDETNNIRRLHLTPDGLNVRAPQCFVLGGVAHFGPAPALDFEDLRQAFHLQKSSLELKLEQLGKGDFLSLLNAPKIGAFLDWLSAADVFVHYQVFNPLYWSIVDVIDSIIDEHGDRELMAIAPLLKNDLFTLLRDNPDETAEFLGRYSYPDVGRANRAAFIVELRDLLEARRAWLPDFNFQMLKGVLKIAAGLESLPYLEDETANVLIDGFGSFYLHRLSLFKHSAHVLDIEKAIQNYLAGLNLADGTSPLTNFTFVDSRTAPWVQVSDALTGLLGKMFMFAANHDVNEIGEALSGLNDRQRTTLDTLRNLIERSIDECQALVHYVISLEDQQRRSLILGF
ncbi:hypothetical protein [Aurantiacibacter flavus]|uniref:Uncharacterized protein n=1 Tax=Aurantiacibacter flavus TaxID=3145232 RepID=A0ABV0CWP6_9SPHN